MIREIRPASVISQIRQLTIILLTTLAVGTAMLGTPWRQSHALPQLDWWIVNYSGNAYFDLRAVPMTMLFATYPTLAFIRGPVRRRRRRRNGWCLACGYDLQGNVSGVCPECGSET